VSGDVSPILSFQIISPKKIAAGASATSNPIVTTHIVTSFPQAALTSIQQKAYLVSLAVRSPASLASAHHHRLSGFLTLSQSRDRPERWGALSRFDTMPPKPNLQAWECGVAVDVGLLTMPSVLSRRGAASS
jgi:hypothetical protein